MKTARHPKSVRRQAEEHITGFPRHAPRHLRLLRPYKEEKHFDSQVDAVLLDRLCAALALIDDDFQDACWQRGLLSSSLSESLSLIRFLAHVLPMARAARAATGIPESYLIADAYQLGHGVDGCSELSVDTFVRRARSLARSRAHAEMIRAANSVEYLEVLQHIPTVVTETIKKNGLDECDSRMGERI